MSDEGTQTPGSATPPEPSAEPPKAEKMVPERDVIAVKEGAKKEVKELKDSHKVAIDAATTQLSEAQQKLLQAEAAKEQLEEQIKQSAGSAEELAKVKQDLETAQGSSKGLSDKVLEYRRQIIVITYGIPADTIADKTVEQLDQYEDALKTIAAAKGIGNYALGGGGGGATAETPMDRAKRSLAEADARVAKRGSSD